MALALDVAITVLEFSDVAPDGVSRALRNDSLIHLRTLRSAALRANREPVDPPVPAPTTEQLV